MMESDVTSLDANVRSGTAAAKARRARRREIGMAKTAGVTKATGGEKLSRSLSLVRAALQVWEAKHGTQTRSVWRRGAPLEAE
jgi:hypothetical protein